VGPEKNLSPLILPYQVGPEKNLSPLYPATNTQRDGADYRILPPTEWITSGLLTLNGIDGPALMVGSISTTVMRGEPCAAPHISPVHVGADLR
jgi:hypothetical protein